MQYYARNEYLRVGHAKRCNIRGTVAVPVFMQGGALALGTKAPCLGAPRKRGGRAKASLATGAGPGAWAVAGSVASAGGVGGGPAPFPVEAGGAPGCVAVLEMVMLDEDVRFKQQLESICQALQMVNLATKPGSALDRVEVHPWPSHPTILSSTVVLLVPRQGGGTPLAFSPYHSLKHNSPACALTGWRYSPGLPGLLSISFQVHFCSAILGPRGCLLFVGPISLRVVLCWPAVSPPARAVQRGGGAFLT